MPINPQLTVKKERKYNGGMFMFIYVFRFLSKHFFQFSIDMSFIGLGI